MSRDSPPVCEVCCVLPLQIYIGAALPELAFKPDSIYIPALEGGWEGVGSEGVGWEGMGSEGVGWEGVGWEGVGGVVQCMGLWVRASL